MINLYPKQGYGYIARIGEYLVSGRTELRALENLYQIDEDIYDRAEIAEKAIEIIEMGEI